MEINLTPSIQLTTNHPASSHGIPVLINRHDSATPYGPADILAYDGYYWPAAKHVVRFAAIQKGAEDIQAAAQLFCAQWPDGPQP